MNAEALKRAAILPPGAFRLILALAVVMSHVTHAEIGRLAVVLFFYLSGFWVARMYRSEFATLPVWTFYASRWLRIAPLYLIAVVAGALLRRLPIHPENILILGVGTTRHDPIWVSWSLDIELQFYLALPLLVALSGRLAAPFLISGCALLTGLGWWLHARFGLVSLLMYLPPFVLGMLNAQMRWTPGPRVAMASLAAFVSVPLLLAIFPYTRALLFKDAAKPIDRDIFAMIWMIPFIPYVAQSLTRKSSVFDRDMGNWTYPLYVIHMPVIMLFGELGLRSKLGALAAIPVALALFYGPDRFFEGLRGRLMTAARTPKAAFA